MGSGKSYEVVSVVIMGAIAKGRRVVSNVAGLNYDAMVALLSDEGDIDSIGSLIQVSHDQVLAVDFWRTDAGGDFFIQPGDLLVLDEVWRFWDGFSDRKMPIQVMNFFRMHRHFVNDDTGFTCDVALISQDIMDVARRVRSVVEETYNMTKLTVVGSSKRYRVDVHSGAKITRKPLRSIQKTYVSKYFPLYSSHSQKNSNIDAKEDNIDGRGNILKGLLFKVVLPVSLPVFGLCVWFLYGFFILRMFLSLWGVFLYLLGLLMLLGGLLVLLLRLNRGCLLVGVWWALLLIFRVVSRG
jgi:zona occludens toxin